MNTDKPGMLSASSTRLSSPFLGACASGDQRQFCDSDCISSALPYRTYKCRERMDAQEWPSAVKGSLS
jgi:hypothetical protein